MRHSEDPVQGFACAWSDSMHQNIAHYTPASGRPKQFLLVWCQDVAQPSPPSSMRLECSSIGFSAEANYSPSLGAYRERQEYHPPAHISDRAHGGNLHSSTARPVQIVQMPQSQVEAYHQSPLSRGYSDDSVSRSLRLPGLLIAYSLTRKSWIGQIDNGASTTEEPPSISPPKSQAKTEQQMSVALANPTKPPEKPISPIRVAAANIDMGERVVASYTTLEGTFTTKSLHHLHHFRR